MIQYYQYMILRTWTDVCSFYGAMHIGCHHWHFNDSSLPFFSPALMVEQFSTNFSESINLR